MRQLNDAPNNNFAESECNVMYSHTNIKVGRYTLILLYPPPPTHTLFSLGTSIQSRSVSADWTRLLSTYGGAWLPLYAKYPQDLLTSTQKYSSAQTPATGSQCGEAMVMAACFALLVEFNNGEHGNVNFIHISITFSSFGPLQCTTSLQ